MSGASERDPEPGRQTVDCLVVGAGPAGLTAALYLARYRRSVIVAHDETSRAQRAPLAHNVPGFPEGVSGAELLAKMQVQAEQFGARVERNTIVNIVQGDGHFEVQGESGGYRCRTVVLATGVSVNEVDLPREEHEKAISWGCLRYCPVCDGFEARDKAVAVLGCDSHGAAEALFLRQYTDRVTVLARRAEDLTADHRRQLADAGIVVIAGVVSRLSPEPGAMNVVMDDGAQLVFDVLYPALGCQARSDLAKGLGILLCEEGGLPTDQGQGTEVQGVYAAGDLVEGLDQISVAIGHGAVAATKAHNRLREIDGEALRS